MKTIHVKSGGKVTATSPEEVKKPVFKIKEEITEITKPVFDVKEDVQVLVKPVYEFNDVAVPVEIPKAEIVEIIEKIEKPVFRVEESEEVIYKPTLKPSSPTNVLLIVFIITQLLYTLWNISNDQTILETVKWLTNM